MSRRTSTRLAIVGAVLLAAAGYLAGCSGNDSTGPSGSATIRGKLLAGTGAARLVARSANDGPGSPISGAQVIVDGAPSGVFTDSDGEFTLTLAPGTHTIAVNAGSGTSASITVVVDGATAMVIEFELESNGRLTAHEDVDDDGDVDSQDDIDHDGNVDDDDADGDIDDDGDIDIDIDHDGDVDDDDRDGDINNDGHDDVGDDSPDGVDDEL